MGNSKKNTYKVIIKIMEEGKRFLNLFFSNKVFLGSFNEITNLPNQNLNECCLIGRTNVGKSSIVNAITKSKKLAKVSKTPGQTKTLNIYEINKKINIVDLPGYGYSKFSKVLRNYITDLIHLYFLNRKNLLKVYVLIDSRLGIKNTDINTFDLISSMNISFAVILTKIDKCSKDFLKIQKKSMLTFLINYPEFCNNIFLVSSEKNEGILDIQKDIIALTR